MTVANVSGQFGQVCFDVLTRLVPVAQCRDDKAVAQIMNPGTVVVGGLAQSDAVRQPDEPIACAPPRQPSALFREQETGTLGVRTEPIPQTAILPEGLCAGGVQRDPARLVEPGLTNFQEALVQIDIVLVQRR